LPVTFISCKCSASAKASGIERSLLSFNHSTRRTGNREEEARNDGTSDIALWLASNTANVAPNEIRDLGNSSSELCERSRWRRCGKSRAPPGAAAEQQEEEEERGEEEEDPAKMLSGIDVSPCPDKSSNTTPFMSNLVERGLVCDTRKGTGNNYVDGEAEADAAAEEEEEEEELEEHEGGEIGGEAV
jgi:hypothetical protein